MITKRIIPCLDVKDGRVVKGVKFEGLSDVSSPVELGKYYSDCGADELVFYDITASAEGRVLFTDILTEVAQNIFIPLTVGGGINTLEDFDRVLKCGADKVSVNSGAIRTDSRGGAEIRQSVCGAFCGCEARGWEIHGICQGRQRKHRHGGIALDCALRRNGRRRGGCQQH